MGRARRAHSRVKELHPPFGVMQTNAPAQAALSSSGAAVRGGQREGGNENVSASLEEVLVTFGDANTARAT